MTAAYSHQDYRQFKTNNKYTTFLEQRQKVKVGQACVQWFIKAAGGTFSGKGIGDSHRWTWDI